jgi:hypothetical protein
MVTDLRNDLRRKMLESSGRALHQFCDTVVAISVRPPTSSFARPPTDGTIGARLMVADTRLKETP